jgi:hypothetical protein
MGAEFLTGILGSTMDLDTAVGGTLCAARSGETLCPFFVFV